MAESKPYRFHPEAAEEFEEAESWYFSRNPDASTQFVADVGAGIAAIAKAPQPWSKYLHGTRRFVLQRFPFAVVYLDEPELVTIIAVAHSKRKPGYWKGRV